MAFVGAGMCGVAFSTAGGENMGAALQVLNVRRVGSHVFGLVPVGSVSSKGVVDLQQSTMKAYHPDLSELPLKDVTSECGDCELADKQKTFMEVSIN
jgi:predicted phosphoribosyltransferase